MGPGPIHVIRLALPANTDFAFKAGQYTAVQDGQGGDIPFSIASAPERLPELELHYQPIPGVSDAGRMNTLLENATSLELAAPGGNVFLTGEETKLLFVSGGSGAAQAWAMLESLQLQGKAPHCTLLWSVEAEDQLYLQNAFDSLGFLSTHIIVDDSRDADNAAMAWLRQHGAHYQDARIVLTGGPGFVWAAVDALESITPDGWTLASDVFDYAPR